MDAVQPWPSHIPGWGLASWPRACSQTSQELEALEITIAAVLMARGGPTPNDALDNYVEHIQVPQNSINGKKWLLIFQVMCQFLDWNVSDIHPASNQINNNWMPTLQSCTLLPNVSDATFHVPLTTLKNRFGFFVIHCWPVTHWTQNGNG